MTAILISLVAISVSLTGFSITQAVWLHSANADRLSAADLLDGQRKLVAEYKSKFDTEFVAHTVTAKELEQERQLLASVVAQRDAAQAKCRAYLARSLEGATEDDVNAVLADLFASPLAVVPKPEAHRSDTGDTALLDPFADV